MTSVEETKVQEEVTVVKKETSPSLLSNFTKYLRLNTYSPAKNMKNDIQLDVETPDSPSATYYGVYIPCEVKLGADEEKIHVYESKEDALKIVKKYKEARFKVLRNKQAAYAFALRGAEIPEERHIEGPSLVNGFSNGKPVASPSLASPTGGEKPSAFKGPKPQELVRLRRAIEAGLLSAVRDTVWDNPRYLISSGDTPSILQEGCRYNAMHVAAKAKNAEMCNLILTTVGDPAFVQLMYGDDNNIDNAKDRASILVDLYLNTPDKSLNETPLHFASKYGALEVVELLVSFPNCNREAKNKFGQMAKDIVCQRTEAGALAIADITRCLSERFYVPVLHGEDDSTLPTVGMPFTTDQPLDLNPNPVSPRVEIRAFAGPMSLSKAQSFRRTMKTPPRRTALQPATFRLKDFTKGLEVVGRNLTGKMQVSWKEYWPFLDTFTDFRTAEGLALLENYFKDKYEVAETIAIEESVVNSTSIEESSNKLFTTEQSPITKEIDLTPISDLCNAFKSCNLNTNNRIITRRPRRLSDNYRAYNEENNVNYQTVSQVLCIERTCQVFAKRIADALNYALCMEPDRASVCLITELKLLQNTIFCYKHDSKFKDIDFSLIHSRLSQLVVYNIRQSDELDIVPTLIQFLKDLIASMAHEEMYSSDEEDLPSYRQLKKVKDCGGYMVKCVAGLICEVLVSDISVKGPLCSSEECGKVWVEQKSCDCAKNYSGDTSSPMRNSFRARKLRYDRENVSSNTVRSLDNSPCGDGKHPVIFDPIQLINSVPLSNESPIISADASETDTTDDEADYETAVEDMTDEVDAPKIIQDEKGDLLDASDIGAVDVFIYGDCPTKMDRLVFDALADVELDSELYPFTYRWRHSVSHLYTHEEREAWPNAPLNDSVETSTPMKYTPTINAISTPKRVTPKRPNFLTPSKNNTSINNSQNGTIPLQVTKWLRVTGANTPRKVLEGKNVDHNVSFGF